MVWNKTYSAIERAYSIVKTNDGGYAFAGSDFSMVKIDATGNEEWSKKYYTGEVGANEANSLVQTTDGGYALAGWKYSEGGNLNAQFWLIKADLAGQYAVEQNIWR